MELIRKQTYITPEQDRAVKRLAQRDHVTEAEILRRALDGLLRQERAREGDDPFAGLIGFVDGPTEIDHDDICQLPPAKAGGLRLTDRDRWTR